MRKRHKIYAVSKTQEATVLPRTVIAPTYFFAKISQPHAALLLLFREKSRAYRLTACKRAVLTPIHTLTTFHGYLRLRRKDTVALTIYRQNLFFRV